MRIAFGEAFVGDDVEPDVVRLEEVLNLTAVLAVQTPYLFTNYLVFM